MPVRTLAVGTTDGTSVCGHLARSASFTIFQVEDGRIVSRTVRDRATNECGQHRSFVELLDGCDTVICGGIGDGAARSLAAAGIQAVVTANQHSVDEAVALYTEGRLATTDARVCLCHK